MKIFLGVTEIAGYYTNLQKGFKQLGIQADFAPTIPHKFKYNDDKENNFLFKLWQKTPTLGYRTPRKKIIKKITLSVTREFIKIIFFLYVLFYYDVLIFGFGTTIYDSPIELWIYKIFRKKLIFMFHGADSRPPYIDGGYVSPGVKTTLSGCRNLTLERKERLNNIDKYASYVVNTIPQSHFHSRKVVNASIFGLPYQCKANVVSHEDDVEKRKIYALHCPSDSTVKGTKEIIEAVSNLNKKGLNLELKLLQGVPNDVVLREIANCDFVIDQLYSDTPMPGFSTEAAHLGKPAVIGGYWARQIKDHVSEKYIPPSLFVEPSEIEEAIEKMTRDMDYRRKLGQQVQEFVRNRWEAKKIAEKYLTLIAGKAPDSWFFDPNKITYLYGSGLSKERVQEVIGQLIGAYGIEALCLSDKTALEKSFKAFGLVQGDLC